LSIFSSALETVRAGTASPEISVLFLLRFSEALAAKEEVEKRFVLYSTFSLTDHNLSI